MESYSFKHVNFTYPETENKALRDVSFSVKKGEFVIFCGPSGCGKTTLLRQLKTCLAPHGVFEGEVLFERTPLHQVRQREQSQKIGFVLQSPENQVVTDKVWHELAFGLESLGYDTPTIRRRVAEIAAFFGIENWFYKNVAELSGGQKQLLSLASVMAMQPSVLVLDEPTAQLDPIAAGDFLALLGRINRELGTTILLTEHRLEEAFPFATRVIVMNKGEILCDDTPQKVGLNLKNAGDKMFLAMPTAMRVWAELETDLACPVTVRDGNHFLSCLAEKQPLLPLQEEDLPQPKNDETVLSCDNLWFRYEKESPDILKGFSLKLKRGEFYALLGGNGAGKTTALKVISGLQPFYRGSLECRGKIGCLPQNPQTLFVKKTVREDLYEAFRDHKIPKEIQDREVERIVSLCGLQEFLERHPYDISGGEQQRAALAKVLLAVPDILLLDEPTKGFDAEFKVTFAKIIRQLLSQGITVLMVSHDVVFCAEYAHRCGLFFDGSIAAEGTPREFFSGNSFYTTPANRMARHLVPKAVTVGDILGCCGKEKRPQEETASSVEMPAQYPSKAKNIPKKLPLWRKLFACLFAAFSLLIFFYATSITDLSALINMDGISQTGKDQLVLYVVLIVSLLGFILAIGRRSNPPMVAQTPLSKRKLSRRTVAAAVLIVFCIPITIFVGVVYLGNSYYGIISIAVLLECMLPFFLVFEGRKPKPRELVVIAVLCAIGVAGRGAFFMLPQFKPVLALTIIAGVAFGGEAGFLVGAVTMLVSNMIFSQGPWTPWQMFSMGTIGFLSGVLFRKGLLRRTRISLAAFGAFSAVVIYGGIMNSAAAVMYNSASLNFEMLLAYYISGFPMDLVHAAATVIFIMLAAEPMLEKMDRIKVKYGLVE